MNFIDLSQVASSSLSYIGQVFNDTLPILKIIFGLIIGFFIIEKIIEIMKGGFTKKEILESEGEEEEEIEI